MNRAPIPGRNISPPEEALLDGDQGEAGIPGVTEGMKRSSYTIPQRPPGPRNFAKRENLSLITTIPSMERAVVPKRPSLPEPLHTRTSASVADSGEHTVITEPVEEQAPPAESMALPKKKKKGLSKQLMLLLRIGITLALVVIVIKGVSWSEVFTIYQDVSRTDLLIALSVGTLGVIFSAYLWHRLVHAENINADLSRLTGLYLVGVAFSNFLPTSMGGDALKAYYVGRDSGNMPGSASAVLMSRITGFFGMLLVALPVLIFLHSSFNGVLIQRFLLLCLLFVGGFGVAFIVGAFLPQIQGKYLKGKWARNKLVIKVFETGAALTASLKKPRVLTEAVFFGFLFWVANCLNYYEYANALGVQVPFRFYLLAVPFIGVVGALPISISGYGVREGLVEYLYSTVHVPTSTALAVVLLMDIQRIFFSLVGGLLFLMMENRERSRKAA